MAKLLCALNSFSVIAGAGAKKAVLRTRRWVIKKLDPRWAEIVLDCALMKTPGGASVYRYRGGEGGGHKYVCPACYEKKQLGLLQPAGQGKFRCPICAEIYQVVPDFGTPGFKYADPGRNES